MTQEKAFDQAAIERRVIEIVKRQLGANCPYKISRSMRFCEDLAADSLDSFELLVEAEDEFKITISDEQAEKLQTVGEAVALVAELVAGRKGERWKRRKRRTRRRRKKT
jgi:acyl carrier protein